MRKYRILIITENELKQESLALYEVHEWSLGVLDFLKIVWKDFYVYFPGENGS